MSGELKDWDDGRILLLQVSPGEWLCTQSQSPHLWLVGEVGQHKNLRSSRFIADPEEWK